MTVDTRLDREQETAYLTVSGKVDTLSGDEFINAIMAGSGKCKNIDLDLSDVPYMSSAGLRGLVLGQKVTVAKGGTLTIRGVNETIAKVLEATRLSQSLNII